MITIKEAISKKELTDYIKFPFSLYKENKYWVPPIIADELETFDKTKNPTFENAEAHFYLAYKNNISYDINVSTHDGTDKETLQIQKLKTATTSSAYIVKDIYVDNILDLFNTCNNNMNHNKLTGDNYEFWALDQKWAELQVKDNWFVLDKDPIKQRDIWSTIMKESHG